MYAARDNVAFRNLGLWDRSNRVNCGRCWARRALVEGYDTRARPFTRSEGRLRRDRTRIKYERARQVVSNSGAVRGVVSLVLVMTHFLFRSIPS